MRPAAAIFIPGAVVSLLLLASCGGGTDQAGREATPTVAAGRTATPARTAAATATATAQPQAATPTAEPATAAPAPPTQTPTRQPAAPTPPPAPPPAANHPPEFPSEFSWTGSTQFEYDDVGRLVGAVTTFTIPAASDPDGDTLSYSWSASNGSIAGNGLTATWTNEIEYGQPKPGTVTVTVSDGRGGSDSIAIESQ